MDAGSIPATSTKTDTNKNAFGRAEGVLAYKNSATAKWHHTI